MNWKVPTLAEMIGHGTGNVLREIRQEEALPEAFQIKNQLMEAFSSLEF